MRLWWIGCYGDGDGRYFVRGGGWGVCCLLDLLMWEGQPSNLGIGFSFFLLSFFALSLSLFFFFFFLLKKNNLKCHVEACTLHVEY